MKNKIKKNHLFSNYLLILILLFCFILQLSVQGVVYVNKNATGANNGNSWADAYTTIQVGINDAEIANEEVWVAKGTYTEAIIMKTGVKLYGGFNGTETSRSQRNWITNVTIIDASTARGGSPAYHVVVMGSITNATIDGFTIKGGKANGGTEFDKRGAGIYCANLNNTNTIANNIITENSASDDGGGISCLTASPVIIGNTISGDSAVDSGGGIYCRDTSSPNITNNTISGNSADYGSGIFCNNSSPNTTNNKIIENSATDGGGIHCWNASPNITDNIVAGNSASAAGGIYCYSSSSPTILHNKIIDNSAYSPGGGIYCYSSSPIISNNIITGNTVNVDGGGIFCRSSSPNIKNNIISGNSAAYAGGVYCYSSSAPTIMNNIIAGNLATNYIGGIFCYTSSSPTIVNCTISGNSANAEGGGVYCQSNSDPQIKNNTFSYNNRYDIYEYDTNSDPIVSYNDFYGNLVGIYIDEGTIPYTSVSEMDAAIAECSNDIGLNPLFVGGTLSGGTWTATPVYSSNSFQTTLTNSSASWTTNKHAGRLLNPDTTQNKQFVIVSNTSTTMNVWGDVTSIAHSGDAYQIFDYHLRSDSPCIDAGCFISGLTEDFEGDPRPFNGTSQIRGDGSDYDIGADEYIRSTGVDNWIFYE